MIISLLMEYYVSRALKWVDFLVFFFFFKENITVSGVST